MTEPAQTGPATTGPGTITSARAGAVSLAELLPRWHRLLDERHGAPLEELLAVISGQLQEIAAGVDRRYRDHFVETAAEELLPHLGELVGYRPLAAYARVHREDVPVGEARRALAAVLAPRRDVAGTVGYRRRKGTLPLLEELAESVASYPARAVETSRLLAHAQPIRLYGPPASPGSRRAERGRLADLRDGAALDLAGTPFETTARTPDVRRAASRHRPGGHTPVSVRLYAWRLRPYAVSRSAAFCIDRARNLYTFSVLGTDTPLVTRPEPEPHAAHIATIDNVPAFIRRRQLADRPADYYGPGKSLAIWLDDSGEPVAPENIVVADLTGWRYRPRRGQVAVDPELGRIAFASRTAPKAGVSVSYHYAFPDDLGGGEYRREPQGVARYRVGPEETYQQVMDAFAAYRRDREAGAGPYGVIEITGTGPYQERFDFALGEGDRLTVRGADGVRPVLRLLDWSSNRPDALDVRADDDCPGDAGPEFTLDGVLVTGRGVEVTGPVASLTLRHATLVPGWSLEPECEPQHPEEPSLVLERTSACVEIDRCVLGTIAVIGDEVDTDPLPIHIRDSVLDATADDRSALGSPDGRHAHAELYAYRTTVIGEVRAHAVRLATETIFTGTLHVARRQIGCLRYSYVPPGSRTPRRFRCQPDLAGPEQAARVRPLLESARYGTPVYARLAPRCAEEIVRGAEDGAEMGVYHDLYQPQRADALRARLAEYTPAGTDAGVEFVT